MTSEKQIFEEACTKLNDYDRKQINMDMFVLGTAFVRIDREGNVSRVRPDDIRNEYSGEKNG